MAKPAAPTAHQNTAIGLALPSGRLRRVPGGFWVGDDHPQIERGQVPKGPWIGVQTVDACVKRAWFEWDGDWHATVTPLGRTVYSSPETPTDEAPPTPA